jgi:hypothetical protein
MPFFNARPHFENRQVVQWVGESIHLSGQTNFDLGGYNAYIYDSYQDFLNGTSGTTFLSLPYSAATNPLSGWSNQTVFQPGIVRVIPPHAVFFSGNTNVITATTQEDVTNYVATSFDSQGTIIWKPLSGLTSMSGSCTPNFYVGTIHPCGTDTVTIAGDLHVLGQTISATTIIETETLLVEDNNIDLNYGGDHTTALGGGITVLSGVSNTENSTIMTDTNGVFVISPSVSATTYYGDGSNLTGIGFTGNTSGDCITNLHVSNIYSCSPLHINPNSEGNIYFGSSSANTLDLTNNRLGLGIVSSASRTTDPQDTLELGEEKWMGFNTLSAAPSTAGIHFKEGVSQGWSGNGADIYYNASSTNDSLVISGKFGGADQGGITVNRSGRVTIGISPSNYEVALTHDLQIGDTTTPATIKIIDGNQAEGYVLTTDSGGTATWQIPTGGGSFTGNTSGDCITDLWLTNLHGCSPITVHDSLISESTNISNHNHSGMTDTIVFGSDHRLTGTSGTISNTIMLGGNGNTLTGTQTNVTVLGGSGHNLNNNFGTSNMSIIGGTNHSTGGFTAESCSIVGGFSNTIGTGSVLSTNIGIFAAGDSSGHGLNSSIIGGTNQYVYAETSLIGAGRDNTIQGSGGGADNSVIIAGRNNLINTTNSGGNGIFSSGLSSITGNETSGHSIIGGVGNRIPNDSATNNTSILGGQYNTGHTSDNSSIITGSLNLLDNTINSVIVGGNTNVISGGTYNVILGGNSHYIGTSSNAAIFGGDNNTVSGSATDSIIIGGLNNVVTGDYSLVGGVSNDTSGNYGVILGGVGQTITSGSDVSSIFGGSENTIQGGVDYSVMVGGRSNILESSYCGMLAGQNNILSGSNNNYSVVIGGSGNLLTAERSAIIGGSGMTATQDDTVYVPNLNIGTIGSGTPNFNLGIDSNGFVVTGTTGGGSTFWEYGNSDSNSLIDNNGIHTQSSPSDYSMIAGGQNNSGDTSTYSFMGGGSGNTLTDANYSGIIGGINNDISGFSYRSGIIGGLNNYLGNTQNSVILGGQNIQGTSSDTAYVPSLNIGTVNSTTPIFNLGIDSNGFVVTGTTGGGSSSKYVTTSGFTASSPITLTHGLGTEDLVVNLWEVSPKKRTDGEVEVIDSNNIKVTMGTTASFKVVIMG